MTTATRIVVVLLCVAWSSLLAAEPLRVGTFDVAASPPIGSPVAYAPARKIVDPLSARGVVLLGQGKPIVLCAVDWIGIGGRSHDQWRSELANAAGTSADRVAVHTLHQHDAPRADFDAESLLAAHGLGNTRFDNAFIRQVIERAAAAVRQAAARAEPVTHLGAGKAKIEQVASNRRILGPDGKVKYVRYSSCRDPKIIEQPEGLIDPYVRLVSFWQNDRPLAVLSYYATHPQSHYGKGDVTCEFVGLARAMREAELPGVLHVHFNGAGGNIAAGKYNDGSPERRPILAQRVADGMKAAWKATVRRPIAASDVGWAVRPVRLPLAPHLDENRLEATLADGKAKTNDRFSAALDLAWVRRNKAGATIDISCLRLGDVRVLHMPGELFVEYQLAAQAMCPKQTVCMAAYGDYQPGYIAPEAAYQQGGYETSPRASHVSPQVERVLKEAMEALLTAGQ